MFMSPSFPKGPHSFGSIVQILRDYLKKWLSRTRPNPIVSETCFLNSSRHQLDVSRCTGQAPFHTWASMFVCLLSVCFTHSERLHWTLTPLDMQSKEKGVLPRCLSVGSEGVGFLHLCWVNRETGAGLLLGRHWSCRVGNSESSWKASRGQVE